MRWLLLAVAAPAFAPGQGLHFGLKAGVPLTAYFDTRNFGGSEYSAATRRYTLGPSLEYRLAGSLGLELDVLFKRMGYVGIVRNFDRRGIWYTSAFDAKGDSWDVPLLAKYRFRRLYVAGGAVVRYVGPIRARGELTIETLTQFGRTTTATPIDTTEPSDVRKRLYPGLAAAAGLEISASRWRLLPEFRYTRWTANIAGPLGYLRFSPNQAEFLLGLLF